MPSDTPHESPTQLAERLDGYIQRAQSEGLSGEELSRFFNQDAPTISRMLRAGEEMEKASELAMSNLRVWRDGRGRMLRNTTIIEALEPALAAYRAARGGGK